MGSILARNSGIAVALALVVAALAWFLHPVGFDRLIAAVAAWCVFMACLTVGRGLFSENRLGRLSLWLQGVSCILALVAIGLVAYAVFPYADPLLENMAPYGVFAVALMTLAVAVPVLAIGYAAISLGFGMMLFFLKSFLEEDSDLRFAL